MLLLSALLAEIKEKSVSLVLIRILIETTLQNVVPMCTHTVFVLLNTIFKNNQSLRIKITQSKELVNKPGRLIAFHNNCVNFRNFFAQRLTGYIKLIHIRSVKAEHFYQVKSRNLYLVPKYILSKFPIVLIVEYLSGSPQEFKICWA